MLTKALTQRKQCPENCCALNKEEIDSSVFAILGCCTSHSWASPSTALCQSINFKPHANKSDKGLRKKLPSRLCQHGAGGPLLAAVLPDVPAGGPALPALLHWLYGELTFPLLGNVFARWTLTRLLKGPCAFSRPRESNLVPEARDHWRLWLWKAAEGAILMLAHHGGGEDAAKRDPRTHSHCRLCNG